MVRRPMTQTNLKVKSMWTTMHYYHHITCNSKTMVVNLKLSLVQFQSFDQILFAGCRYLSLFRHKDRAVHTVSAIFSLFLSDTFTN